MKKIYLLVLFVFGFSAFAQQKGISYQAVIINPKAVAAPGFNGTSIPLANKSICLSFQIMNSANQVEYQESQSITTDAYGMVNVVIGTGTSGTGLVSTLEAVSWNQGSKKLVVGVNTDGVCSNYTEISNQVLNYTPYAYYALNSDIKDGSVTDPKVAMGINPAKVGLGNVNNTSDANKPVSTATQTALNLKANTTDVTTSLALKEDVSNKSNASLGSSTTLYPTQNAVKAYVDSQISSATIVDADATTKGKIKLAGDLAGTADLPTVPGLALKADTSSLSPVAISGNYNDLTNKPSIPSSFALPTATASVLGGVKVGANLSIDANGVLTASGSGVPYAGATQSVDLGAYDLKVNGLTVGRGKNGNTDSNIAIGKDVLRSVTGGSYLTAVGHEALYSNTTGYNNTAIGSAALKANTSGLANTAIGSNSLQSSTTANFVTAVGNHALKNNTTGANNTAVGSGALEFNTTGELNSAVGYDALKKNTTGSRNTAIGVNALVDNTTGSDNTATGFGALLRNTTGSRNTATGWYALALNTIGEDNTAVGYTALYPNTTGTKNTAVGQGALKNNSTGNENSALGEGPLANNTTGQYNSAFGRESLHMNSTGEFNTGFGWKAGFNNTIGNNNTAIGAQANFGANNLTNATAIGYQANVTASNSIQLGNASVTNVKTSGTITAGVVTYPKIDGTAGQVLTANANGIPTWQSVSNGLPTASASTLGGIKVGTGLSIDGNGVLSGASSYSLPTASASTLGGIKVGTGLSIDGNGVLSGASSYSLPTASASELGGVKVGTGLTITGGVLSASPTFTGAVTAPIYASTPQALTDAATISWNPANGLNASVTLGGNRTLSFSTAPASGSYGTLVITQDVTGGRTLTLPSTTNRVLGSISTTTVALSSAANAKDILNFYFDGTTYFWNIGQGYGTAASITANNLAGGAAGSIPYQIATGATGFLAKGTDGQILTLASGVPSWTAASATGVTSVDMTTPTGLSVSGSPITSSGTLALSLTSGYAIPTTTSQTNWDAAYTNRITSATSPLSISSNAVSLGTVPVANGGTGITTTPTNGQILIGNGTGFALATLTSGTGVSITNGGGSITINASARSWTDQPTVTANQTSFTLTYAPTTNSKIWMFINGVRTNNNAYSFSGTTVTYAPASNGAYAITASDRVQFDYTY